MPAEFCLQDLKHWESKDDVYNPSSNECITCLKDFPDQPAICAARTAYLVSLSGKKSKVKGTKTPKVKVPKDGRVPQTVLIDGFVRQQFSIAQIVQAVSDRDYPGNLSAAETRVVGHLKATVGTHGSKVYARSVEMKPLLDYLSAEDAKKIGLKKAAAPVAPAA
jgi:hypothetical protein